MAADRIHPPSSDRPGTALAALAGALLDRPAPAEPLQRASEAATEIALPIPERLRSPELVAAIARMARGDADGLREFERELDRAELFCALRPRTPSGPIRSASDYALVVVTTSDDRRLLPLFTTQALLRAHANGSAVCPAPLTTTRALELALGMGFDGVEIDRGSPQAYRLSRLQMQRLHQALYQTLV